MWKNLENVNKLNLLFILNALEVTIFVFLFKLVKQEKYKKINKNVKFQMSNNFLSKKP